MPKNARRVGVGGGRGPCPALGCVGLRYPHVTPPPPTATPTARKEDEEKNLPRSSRSSRIHTSAAASAAEPDGHARPYDAALVVARRADGNLQLGGRPSIPPVQPCPSGSAAQGGEVGGGREGVAAHAGAASCIVVFSSAVGTGRRRRRAVLPSPLFLSTGGGGGGEGGGDSLPCSSRLLFVVCIPVEPPPRPPSCPLGRSDATTHSPGGSASGSKKQPRPPKKDKTSKARKKPTPEPVKTQDTAELLANL